MTNFDNIPEELKRLQRWVCASSSSKLPMIADDPVCPASVSRDSTWRDYIEAKRFVERGIYDYLGYVFAADDGYIGIDIDDGFDEDGFINPLSADIIRRCNSYTEKSRSGRGFHILLRGKLPFGGRNNHAGVEMYTSGRYFILTGDIVLGFTEIVENQAAIDYVVERYFPEVVRKVSAKGSPGRNYNPVWIEPITDGKVKLRPIYPEIPHGCRNICLTSLAGILHNQGYRPEQIYDELLYANTVACKPPLDDEELNTIVRSVTRYIKR